MNGRKPANCVSNVIAVDYVACYTVQYTHTYVLSSQNACAVVGCSPTHPLMGE